LRVTGGRVAAERLANQLQAIILTPHKRSFHWLIPNALPARSSTAFDLSAAFAG
jgi:hypothetical protein